MLQCQWSVVGTNASCQVNKRGKSLPTRGSKRESAPTLVVSGRGTALVSVEGKMHCQRSVEVKVASTSLVSKRGKKPHWYSVGVNAFLVIRRGKIGLVRDQ